MTDISRHLAFPATRSLTTPLLSAGTSRMALLVASYVFAYVLLLTQEQSLSVRWAYFGFSYSAPGFLEVLVGGLMIASSVYAVPLTLDRPSAVVLQLLHVSVILPTIVITLALRSDSISEYGWSLLALCVAFVIAGRMSVLSRTQTILERGLPSAAIVNIGLFVWVVATVAIVARYAPIMSFANLDEVYEQRFAIERDVNLLGYVRLYYLAIFCPFLIAIGLMRRRRILTALGILGCIVSYMVDAQKTALMFPFLLLVLAAALTIKRSLPTALLLTIMLTLSMVAEMVLRGSAVGDLIGSFFVHRLIATPGLMFSQYYDLFSTHGYTWWSNVAVIRSIVPPPAAYMNDPGWPALGQVVGTNYLGPYSEVNMNANLFAGDGIAAAGAFGVLVVGVALTLWLRVVDWSAAGWNLSFVLLVLMPVAIALTNGHLTTVIVSFGGGFWPLAFALYKPTVSEDCT